MPTERGRVLVIRAGALGDFVLTLPLLRSLRGAFPAAQVHLATYADLAPLALEQSLADGFSRVDDPLFSPLSSGRASAALKDFLAPFARAVCIWRDPERRIASALERAGVPAVHHVEPIPPEGSGVHCAEYMLSQLPPDWPRAAPIPELRPAPDARRRAHLLLRDIARAERVYLVHPGSGGRGADRNWPPERFAEIVERLRARGRALALLRGPADEKVVERTLAALCGPPAPVLDGLDVSGLAALLSLCAGYVGNDSGVSHLAAAVGAPTVAVFGATDPALWAPRGPRALVLRPAVLPDGRRAPIASITADDVLAALERLAGGGAAG